MDGWCNAVKWVKKEINTKYRNRADKISFYVDVRMLQASWGRSGKQQQEQTLPNHLLNIFLNSAFENWRKLIEEIPEHHAPNVHDGERHVYPSFNPRNYYFWRSLSQSALFPNLMRCQEYPPADIMVAAQSLPDCRWGEIAPVKNTIRRNRKY